jgi:hypothetical protein
MEYFSFLPRYLQKQFRSTLQPLKQKIAFFEYLRGTFYSLPLQLLFLHFRKYQVLLLFWVILFATVGGAFMKSFGAEALFLAPEYMGDVNALGAALVGVAIGIFIMCWNVTTFILYSRHFTFLAATQYPFLKYCINNSAIPLFFLIFYLIKAYGYLHSRELIDNIEIAIITGGFLIGLLLVLTISFLYFFSADRTIFKILQPLFSSAKNYISHLQPEKSSGSTLIRSEWFLDSFYRVRRCRDVSHYSQELMEKIFKRHHFAAVLSIFVVYLFLLVVGFFIDYPFFQFPAGASATLLFAILIGVTGAIVYFFQSWSVPALLLFLLVLNALYQVEWIDPRNKAYGLNYGNEERYPLYTQQNIDSIAASPAADGDKKNMEAILGRWKEKQGEEKPLLVVVTTSGGGNRSATFTMNVLQRLDSLTGGAMMKKTFLFTGASGGMIGATYFRELYRQRLTNQKMYLQSAEYVDNIASDLLNPIFTSFVARDVFAPERRFSVGPYTYLRDRGLAFEEALNRNTDKVLEKKLGDYAADEKAATIPLMLYHTLVTRDGKKMHIGTQPMRFMMQAPRDTAFTLPVADAIDFTTFFARQDPYNLRMLTVLRMNATFPVVLPNVWMPSEPVIDVMDGGLRDNFGVETSMRFISHLQNWIKENTRGVLLVQIRDRMDGGWEHPYEFDDLMQNATKPFFLLQHNWYKMMEYYQRDMATYFFGNSAFPVHNITFQYIPRKEEHKAALSFHLTRQEKMDIAGSLKSLHNQESFKRVLKLFGATDKSAENNLSQLKN